MADHYYTREPHSASAPKQVIHEYKGRLLRFATDSGTFSKDKVDAGSALLLDAIAGVQGRCADVGCGWGAIGLSLAAANPAAHFTLIDVNLRALELADKNARANALENVTIQEGDGLDGVSDTFDLVVTNPPIRAGKDTIYRIFAQAHERLRPGGALYAVIRKQQGAPSAQKYLSELFGSCEIAKRGGGYHVLHCPRI